MDQTKKTYLPDSAQETQAEIEVYKLIRGLCDQVRKGDHDVNEIQVALRELRRCDTKLATLTRHLKRFGRRNHLQPA